jgi:hypothetical protein
MRPRSDDLEPADRKLLDDVDEFGVHIVHVPDDEEGPGYSFTIGLWHTFEQPEIVVFGMPEDVAHDLLNSLADDAAENKKFVADSRHDEVLVGYPVRFLAVPAERYAEYLGAAVWAYEGTAFPCVQLVWPDKQGRWPWDAGTRDGFAASQPVLGRSSP